MRLSKVLTATAFAGVMALAATSPASATTVGGISFPAGAVFKAATISEVKVFGIGNELSGIGQVLSIGSTSSSATDTWVNGQGGRELTFRFSGYIVEKINVITLGVKSQVLFSGGNIEFWSDSSQDFTVNSSGSGNPSGQPNDIMSATNTDLSGAWLSLVGAGNGTVCTFTNIGDCPGGLGIPITLDATVNFTGNLGAVDFGTGGGFLDVVGGLAASNFNTNTQPGGQDMFLSSSFSKDVSSSNDFPVSGTANARSFAIPEPGTLALFGFGLLGLGFAARRRRRKTAA